ncbi:MAG: Mov34/MPN/PAD-1 family protein [Thermoleophilaceae bacterium]|nr:Mov34/MPN/PAD-1 family protein [Thermoleophilaceae bacterium]
MTGERGMSGYTVRVRDVIYEHVFAHPGAEVGGVLVGARLGEGRALLQGSVRADLAEGDLTSLTFTQDAWEEIHSAIERDHTGSDIVGWYHSHPGHGIFLSGHDEFIHRNFFADPSCLALVIDPIGGREGLFGWEEGELRGFWERETAWPGVESELSGGLAEMPAQASPPQHSDPSPTFVSRERGVLGQAAPRARGALTLPLLSGLAIGVIAGVGLHAVAAVLVAVNIVIGA